MTLESATFEFQDDGFNAILDKFNDILSKFENLQKGGETVSKFEELLQKYGKTAEDITFEHENMSDEELEAAFEAAFATQPETAPESQPELQTGVVFSAQCGEARKEFSLSLSDKISAVYELINATYADGCLGFVMDMTYFDQHTDWVELWGEPFITMYNEYLKDKQNNKWQQVPDSRAYVVKVNLDDPLNPIPPYIGLFNSIIGLADDEDLQETKDAASVYKLLAFEMETKGDDPDDFKVDPDTALDYVNRANESLPPYVGSILSPLKVNPISFEKDQAADVNIIENATKNLDGMPEKQDNEDKDDVKARAEIKKIFGRGLSEDDYLFLQDQYDDWRARTRS